MKLASTTLLLTLLLVLLVHYASSVGIRTRWATQQIKPTQRQDAAQEAAAAAAKVETSQSSSSTSSSSSSPTKRVQWSEDSLKFFTKETREVPETRAEPPSYEAMQCEIFAEKAFLKAKNALIPFSQFKHPALVELARLVYEEYRQYANELFYVAENRQDNRLVSKRACDLCTSNLNLTMDAEETDSFFKIFNATMLRFEVRMQRALIAKHFIWEPSQELDELREMYAKRQLKSSHFRPHAFYSDFVREIGLLLPISRNSIQDVITDFVNMHSLVARLKLSLRQQLAEYLNWTLKIMDYSYETPTTLNLNTNEERKQLQLASSVIREHSLLFATSIQEDIVKNRSWILQFDNTEDLHDMMFQYTRYMLSSVKNWVTVQETFLGAANIVSTVYEENKFDLERAVFNTDLTIKNRIVANFARKIMLESIGEMVDLVFEKALPDTSPELREQYATLYKNREQKRVTTSLLANQLNSN